MKAIVASIAVPLLVTIVAASAAPAQQLPARATPVSRISGTPSSATIKLDFLRQQADALEIDIRVALRCIETAQMRLRDVEGEINRVASTDIINCGRRLSELQRQLAKLERASARLGEEAAAEAEILLSLKKQKEMLQSVSESMGAGSGGSP
jgi:chromosome segregation ATPase